jgi:KUP system potassium uptake protein
MVQTASQPAVRAETPAHGHPRPGPTGKALLTLAAGAVGVVYGDIGTSPLYAMKECFTGAHSVPPTPANVLGVLSLVFWSLVFVVVVKYLAFVMRADNRGEGGILALLALVGGRGTATGRRRVLLPIGLFGAALLYGDGVITPAISVLGAIEGLTVAAPGLEHFVVPIAVGLIVGLFAIQKHGTARVGAIFGPVMLVWFAAIAVLGFFGLLRDPTILRAIWPGYAVAFFAEAGVSGYLILGSVVLVITGGEALYADMGHFGRKPIRLAWYAVVMPALLLNYFGQGALLLHDASAARNPFYLLAPSWALYPLIAVATCAAIVASQALISGAFSLTQQAVQLGYCPRVTIRHTSWTEIGQIYIPEVNWALGVACVALVLGFQTSSNLASAYGIAVTGTMATTTVLFHRVTRDSWGWPRWKAWPLTLTFMAVDLAYVGANLVKVEEGGWFPLAAALFVFALMSTWKKGRRELAIQLAEAGLPLDLFIPDLARRQPPRVPGTAVFLTSSQTAAPPVLLHHLKHNKVLHERVLLVSITNEDIPNVPEQERTSAKELGAGFWQVIGRYGFMEKPDVPKLLASLATLPAGGRLEVKPMETTFYLGRETILPDGTSKMWGWRKRLFIVMSRNAQTASQFFGLPPNRVVEMGAQIQL